MSETVIGFHFRTHGESATLGQAFGGVFRIDNGGVNSPHTARLESVLLILLRGAAPTVQCLLVSFDA